LIELASAFEPPDITGATGIPVDFEKPVKRDVASVAYASAEYEISGPCVNVVVRVDETVSVENEVTVVLAPEAPTYSAAKTPTAIINTTIIATAAVNRLLPVLMVSVMQAAA